MDVCFNVLSLNVRGIRDLHKVNRSSHGLGNRKRILFFCKRRIARKMFFIVGNFSGREICTFRTDLIIAEVFFR